MISTNIKNSSSKKCAFCKHWYDVTNSAIKPKAPQAGFWEYDEKAKNTCLLTGLTKGSNCSCGEYECKL